MRFEKQTTEYISQKEAFGRFQMKSGGGRISVLAPIFSDKGNYFLFND